MKWLCKTKLIVLYNSMFEQRTGITTQYEEGDADLGPWIFLVLIQFKNYIQLITVKLSLLFWHHNSRFQYFLLLFLSSIPCQSFLIYAYLFSISAILCYDALLASQHHSIGIYNYAWQLKYSHSLTPDQTAKTHWKLQRDRPNGIFVCRLNIGA